MIESGFGNFAPFNNIVRSVFREKVGLQPKVADVQATAVRAFTSATSADEAESSPPFPSGSAQGHEVMEEIQTPIEVVESMA